MTPIRSFIGHRAYVTLFMLVALFIRWRASLGEFWLDEVWSWYLVQTNVQTWSDIVLKLHHDNNHFLNSWFIYVLGPDCDWTTYRLPAVVCGIATVALAGWWGRQSGSAAGWFALWFVGGSYVLIHYSSEARGYAPMLCLSLLGLMTLERALQSGQYRWDILWNVCVVLGILSHVTFLSFFASTAVWSCIRLAAAKRPLVSYRGAIHLASRLARLHLVPLLFFAWLYVTILRKLIIAGGVVDSPFTIIFQALSLTVGGPYQGPGSYLVGGGVIIALLCGIAWLCITRQKALAAFFVMAIVIFPAILALFSGRDDFYVRYFLSSILYSLLLFSRMLGQFWNQGLLARAIAVSLACGFAAGNMNHVQRLCQVGRGNYLTALNLIQRETRQDIIRIEADNAFRHRLMISFYEPFTIGTKPIEFYGKPWPAETPEWVLMHNFERDWQPDASITPIEGKSYELVKAFPYSGLSGWSLGVYRHTGK